MKSVFFTLVFFFFVNFSKGQVIVNPYAKLDSTCSPILVTSDKLGNIYSLNSDTTISKITSTGILTKVWVKLKQSPNLNYNSFSIDTTGSIYITNNDNSISKILSDGTLISSWAKLASGTSALSMVFDKQGILYTY